MSASERRRQEGNKHYQSLKEGLAPVLKESRLKTALICYQEALNLGSKQDEKGSASKNIGVANFALAKLLYERSGENQTREVTYHFVQALTSYSAALNYGSCKSHDWRDSLLKSLQECAEEAMETCSSMSFEDRSDILRRYIDCLEGGYAKAQISIYLTKVIFHEGIMYFQKRDGKKCLYMMRECNFPIEEARKHGKLYESVMKEVSVLEEDVYIYTCISESLIARATGDQLFEIALKDQEAVNMDLIWEIIDWYKQAILLTRENDPEMEAIAHSRLGVVYDKVFRLKTKATEYFKQALQLALSMKPRMFESEAWFRKCTDTLEKYQKEVVEQEDKKWQKERAKYIDELRDELKELEKKNKLGDQGFLQYVYKTFPPKDINHKLNDFPSPHSDSYRSSMKKILRDAVIHYHPDRANVDKNGMKWKVICEEITKRISCRYEVMK